MTKHLVTRLSATAALGVSVLLASGCATPHPAVGSAPPASPTTLSTGPAAPGSVTVTRPADDLGGPALSIRDATVRPEPDGTVELVMTVTNTGDAPSHLVSVTTADAAGTTLVLSPSQRAAQAGQAPNDDGIPLAVDEPVHFEPGQSEVVLDHPTHLTPGGRARFTLYFADVGLVHLTANIA